MLRVRSAVVMEGASQYLVAHSSRLSAPQIYSIARYTCNVHLVLLTMHFELTSMSLDFQYFLSVYMSDSLFPFFFNCFASMDNLSLFLHLKLNHMTVLTRFSNFKGLIIGYLERKICSMHPAPLLFISVCRIRIRKTCGSISSLLT